MSTPAQSDCGGSSPAEHEVFAATKGYAPQRWSAELPAAAGWWWVDQTAVPIRAVIKVQLLDGIPYAFAPAHDKWVECKRFNAGARWAGPLPEPLDAPDAEPGHTGAFTDGGEDQRT